MLLVTVIADQQRRRRSVGAKSFVAGHKRGLKMERKVVFLLTSPHVQA